MASAISVSGCGRRVVAQWMWLSVSSLRSAWCGLPWLRKYDSSSQVGYSGEQSRRETAKAPQALAQVAAVSSGSPRSQPRRKPAMKASPAPSTLWTSIGKPLPTMPSSIRSGIAPGKTTQPIGPRLRTRVASVSERTLRSDGERVVAAAGDPHLFLGADHQVAAGKDGLEVLRDPVGLDVALLAGGMTGEAPEVRAVVDVEDHLPPGFARDPHRLPLRGVGIGTGEVGAGDDDRLRRGDQGRVDVGLGDRHVGAVLADEDQRERRVVLDRQEDEGGEPVLVDLDAGGRNTLALELLEEEAAHLLGADAGDDGRPQPEPRRADGDVGGTAADRLGEGRNVLQPGADLLAVKVDRGPADGDDIEGGGIARLWHLRSRNPLDSFKAAI